MRRHRLDPFSLVFGAIFSLLGMTFLITRVGLDLSGVRWIWPLPLVVIGVLVILIAARGERGEPPDSA